MKTIANKKTVSDSERLALHRERQEKFISKYREHYNTSKSKIAAVSELSRLKGEYELRARNIIDQIKPEIEQLKTLTKLLGNDRSRALKAWSHHINHTYRMALSGVDHAGYYKDSVLSQADELNLPDEVKAIAKFILEGCPALSKWRLKASILDQLINYIANQEYPVRIGVNHPESIKDDYISPIEKIKMVEKVRKRPGIKSYDEALDIIEAETGGRLFKDYNSFKSQRHKLKEHP